MSRFRRSTIDKTDHACESESVAHDATRLPFVEGTTRDVELNHVTFIDKGSRSVSTTKSVMSRLRRRGFCLPLILVPNAN